MKQICLRCDGLGALRTSMKAMDPLHNIAPYQFAVYEDGQRGPFYARLGFGASERKEARIVALEKPCSCADGFVSWTRGKSLTPESKA